MNEMTCPIALTPLSVRPAAASLLKPGTTFTSALRKVDHTVRSPGT